MTSQLPTPGGDANTWGTMLNDFLQQSLIGNLTGSLTTGGQLVTAATNPYTGNPNTNLSTGSQPGLVQLSNDLGGSAASPSVVAIQGHSVSSSAPTDGYVLTWSAGSSNWQPIAPGGTGWGLNGDVDGGGSTTIFGGTTPIDGGVS
jgi:hypothetical protein